MARVDRKADRLAVKLRVLAAHLEEPHAAERLASARAQELRRRAAWLDLEAVFRGRCVALAAL